ncbi:hypothetical protein AWENTII_006958 [Aspergillus wentii]
MKFFTGAPPGRSEQDLVMWDEVDAAEQEFWWLKVSDACREIQRNLDCALAGRAIPDAETVSS